MKISLKEMTKILKGQILLGDPKTTVHRAVVDSRKVKDGDIFFALSGANVDGHDFALMAGRNGARAIVAHHINWLKMSAGFDGGVIQVSSTLESLDLLARYLRGTFKGRVVGITGSNGKTTTKQMLSSILNQTGPGLATTGNYNSQIGLPMVLSLLEPEHNWMVLEMGASEPGNIHKLADLARPHVGVITNIGPAHLATFGSLARVAESKFEILENIPSDGAGVLPWGEPSLEPHIRKYSGRIVFFGEDSACPIRASSIQSGEKVSFMLHVGGESKLVNLPVGGRFNVRNALAASAAAWVLDVPLRKIVSGLEAFKPAEMRMERITHSSGTILINDAYNANPASLMNSVQSFVETYNDREKYVVVGSMLELGSESEKLHFHVGAEIGRCPIKKVFLLGDETAPVREGAVASGFSEKNIVQAESLIDLTSKVESVLGANSAILFKGSRSVQLEKVVMALVGPVAELDKK